MKCLGFFLCKAEPDIWMRRNKDIYKYVAVYVLDLALALKDPAGFVKKLEEKIKFKLKGTGPMSFHLGCDFFRDSTGTLCYAPRKYTQKSLERFECMFGEKPSKEYQSPIKKGDTQNWTFLTSWSQMTYRSTYHVHWCTAMDHFH